MAKRRSKPYARHMVALLSAALVAYQFVAPSAAFGSTYHGYSKAQENTGSGFTGIQATHPTQAVSGQESTGCTYHYDGNPVYETQWVLLTSDQLNWNEIGVAHQCHDGFRYYYWGYGDNGNWYSLGTLDGASNGATHTYQISRSFTGTYYEDFWKIDGSTKTHAYSPQRGVFVMVGLETYTSIATVNGYANSSLKYQKNEGSFTAWSGKDWSQVYYPYLCGRWASDTQWNAGENATC